MIEEIKKTGKNLGLSYVQSLSLYLFEQILCQVSQSTLGEDMWLKESEFYFHERKKKTAPNQIIFYMKGISWQKLERLLEDMGKKDARQGFWLEHRLLFLDKQIEIQLNMQVDQVKIPFRLLVRPVWQPEQEQFPTEGTYDMVFQENREIKYKSYPPELNLAESFYEILDHLELIGTMEAYGTVDRILKTHAVDGRRFYLEMKELFQVYPLVSQEKRWDTVLGYRDYRYMKKRWMKYKKGGTPWEELMDWMKNFFNPVWESIREDTIFFGDWMPNLGRYLD